MPGFTLHMLFFLSGLTALGYQLVWVKMLATGLGHEMPAVLALVGAFMAGTALGAALLDRFVPRTARAGLWLGALEATIGAWAIAASFLIPQVNELALRWIGLEPSPFKHWLMAFALPALALLPATAAMGATFPAMEKFLGVVAPTNSSIGSVYAANTFGAVAGTLLAPFALMPALGLRHSCFALAAVNGVVSVGAFLAGRSADRRRGVTGEILPGPRVKPAREHADSAGRIPIAFPRLAVTLFMTGLLGITYETAGVRVLAQVLQNTVFTYAAVLAVFLAGTAAGAATYHRSWRQREPRRLLATLLNATALACFTGMLLMARAPWLYSFARHLGDSTAAVLAAELLTASVAFALPTFCMGATFSHLVQLARGTRGHVGDAVAINTMGAALAPALGVALIPLMGTKWVLSVASAGYALLLPAKPNLPVAALGGIAAAFALFTNLCLVSVPPGGEVVAHREGVMAAVAVIQEGNDRTLRVDNHFQMGGTAAADAEYRQAHLPLLLHPAPERALFLGVGTGISFGAAALYPGLKADGVELVPEVAELMPKFAPENFSSGWPPNLTLHVADARRFVRATAVRYDVIVADLFHPYRDGAGALYTREHFSAIRQRLAPNGLFCQWLPAHQLDAATLRSITRTFVEVFPTAEAWLLRFNVEVPVVALVGEGNPRWSENRVEGRLNDGQLSSELKRLALADSVRLFGHLLADPADLRAFAGDAPLNTDDNQRVTLMAPRAAYRRDVKSYESLLALLAASKTRDIAALHLSLPGEESFARRVSTYLEARNVYLRGLVHDAENRRDDALDAYIESARLSADFTSGYAQCLNVASVIASSDPARSKRILERLAEAQPERPVAKEMLERLFPR